MQWILTTMQTLNGEAEALLSQAEALAGERPALARQFLSLARNSNEIGKALHAAYTAGTISGLEERIASAWMQREMWLSASRAEVARGERRAKNRLIAARPRAQTLKEQVKALAEELRAQGKQPHNLAGIIAPKVKRTAARVRQILREADPAKRKTKGSAR